jgi:GT2 family glycosyltransferase
VIPVQIFWQEHQISKLSNKPNILFLLVSYFNEEEVCAFIDEQLIPSENNFIDVVITDNGSRTSLLNDIEHKYVNVALVKSGSNLGYFGAANFGLTNYLDRNKEYPQAVIICNTDVQLADDFFNVLQNKLAESNFDILGPSIYSTLFKHNQNPYIIHRIKESKLKSFKFISSAHFLYNLFTFYHLIKNKLFGRANKHNEAMKPYAIHGSFMVFNKAFFQKGGTLNYPCVLFGEELFIAEQALKLNLNMLYEPSLQVEHNEHATTGTFKSKEAVAYLHQSYAFLLNTYFK